MEIDFETFHCHWQAAIPEDYLSATIALAYGMFADAKTLMLLKNFPL